MEPERSYEDPVPALKRRKLGQTDRGSTTLAKESERIRSWLHTVSSDCNTNDLEEAAIPEDNMPRKRSLSVSELIPPTDITAESSKTSITCREPNYRNCAELRNIFIYQEEPSDLLSKRAKGIISKRRSSPELEDGAAAHLTGIALRMDSASEDAIALQLASELIPAMRELPDSRLNLAINQLWANAVPIPTRSTVFNDGLPLARPKPDCTFGFSRSAFTQGQSDVANLLVDQCGHSYASPETNILFPFLSVEFKSGAKGGTHAVGTNQASNAGAIALQGHLELMRRVSSSDPYDFDMPKFFSITLDALCARINVHWVKKTSKEGEFTFHVAWLAVHCILYEDGIRAVQQSVKNIFDHFLTEHLTRLSSTLETYRIQTTIHRSKAIIEKQRDIPEKNESPPPEVDAVKKRRRKQITASATKNKNAKKATNPAIGRKNQRQTNRSKDAKNQTTLLQSIKQFFQPFFNSIS